MGKFIKRKDNQCQARVLAVNERGVLVEAKWLKNNSNICFLTESYFAANYGRDARTCM